jgi:hypothetical protein
VVGFVQEHRVGRTQAVYACRHIPVSLVNHEWRLTQFLIEHGLLEALRGSAVDQELLPDATVGSLHLELDTGSMGYEQVVRDRFPKYAGREDLVLWICLRESRLRGLMRRCRLEQAMFTVLGWAHCEHASRKRMAINELISLANEGH